MGLGDFSTSGGGSSSGGSGGGLGSFSTGGSTKKKKSSGGLLGGLKKIGGGALEILGAPQQIVFGLGSAIGDSLRGDFRSAGHGFTHAAKELGTLGLSKDNWDFAQMAGGTNAQGQRVGAKLPKGLNTAATLLVDPLAATAIGKGAQAKKGISTLARLTGQHADDVSRGVKTGKLAGESFSVKKGTPMRGLLEEEIAKDILKTGRRPQKLIAAGKTDKAVKFAEKKAGKIGKMTARRGEGGLNMFVPFTEKSINVIEAGKMGAPFKDAANLAGKTALGAKVIEGVGEALVPGRELANTVGKELSDKIRRLGDVRSNTSVAAVDDLKHELRNAVESVGRPLTSADDAAILRAVEEGEEAIAALKAEAPELETLVDTVTRNRDYIEQIQKDAGLIGQKQDTTSILDRIANQSDKASAARAKADEAATQAKNAAHNARLAQTQADKFGTQQTKQAEAARRKARLMRQAAKTAEKKANEAKQAWLKDAKPDLYKEITTYGSPEEVVAAQRRVDEILDQAAEIQREIDRVFDEHMAAGRDFREGIDATQELGLQKEALTREANEIVNRLNDANQGHGILPQEVMQWDPFQARVWEDSVKADLPPGTEIPPNRTIEVESGMFVHTDDAGKVDGIMLIDDHGIEIMARPDTHGTGVGRALKEGAREAGYDVDNLTGLTGYTPMGAKAAAGDRAHRAADVAIDFTDPKAEDRVAQLAKVTQQHEAAAKQAKELRDMAKELARGANKGSKSATAKAARADVKAKKAEAKVKKLKDELVKIEEGNAGLRENYMARVATDEMAKGLKSKRARQMITSGGSLNSALDQAATQARTIFPDMPAALVNEMKVDFDFAIENGLDPKSLLTQRLQEPEFRKFAAKDPDAAIAQVEDFMRVAENVAPGAQFYQETALGSLLTRAASAHRAVAGVEYIRGIRELGESQGRHLLLDDEGLQTVFKGKIPEGWVEMKLPGNQPKMYAPVELAREMNKVVKFANADDFTSRFGKAMDAWINFWKSHATTGILGAIPFVARNGRSNVFLMMSDGMGPQDVARYMKDAKALEDKILDVLGSKRLGKGFRGKYADDVAERGVDAVLKDVLSGYDYDLYRAMQEEGILTSGFFDVDFHESLSDTVRKLGVEGPKRTGVKAKVGGAAKDVLSKDGKVTSWGRDLNQAVERNARMASFMFNVDRFGDVQEAARQTKKVLFDYSELTEFEKKVMKRVIPFYTFMRKNLPHQLTTLAEHPMRIALPEKVSATVSGGAPEDMADYQEQAGARQVNPLTPFLGGQISTPDRPFYAAVETLSPAVLAAQGRGKEAARAAANLPGGPQVGGLLAAIEAGTGYDSFTGNKIQDAGGAGEFARRIAGSQLPSLGRLPRAKVDTPVGTVNPARAISGKTAQPTVNELLKFLTGIRVTEPGHEPAGEAPGKKKATAKGSGGRSGGLGSFSTKK